MYGYCASCEPGGKRQRLKEEVLEGNNLPELVGALH